ncbi:glycosyltransferase [Winogradskyella sp. 3972H.M.0a.05]|uniref:glycosyltransferase family 4 protein n=1 Tax=Winogradskyella sp. 3972H.M.0a.05 TaxID=2950277 RepID=UPI0033944D22
MKRVLYIGNNLNHKNSNISSIQSLGALFAGEGIIVYLSSNKVNKLLRLLDMVSAVITKRRKVDIVIIDTYSTQNFYYALIISQLCRFLRLDYVPSLNGGNLPNRLEKNPSLCKLIFSNSFKNVSPSIYLLESFKKFGYKNVAFIPNTIEIKNYKYFERTDKSIKLLWVRSFSKIYNPSMAIHVLKLLKESNYDASLCMVGPDSDGSLSEVKDLAASLDLDVEFTGKLAKEKWIELSENYNIFINTTNFDNMPVSVIEAMALGLPIVSTNVGGIPYLIENGADGLLVEPNNPEIMVDAVISIIEDESLRKRLAANAREKVEQFDWDIVKKQWFEVLK